jgi:hypothetical protein
MTISLHEARSEGLLAKFAEQESKRGVGPISLSGFDKGVGAIIKAPQSPDQTSSSHAPDYLTGKKTR